MFVPEKSNVSQSNTHFALGFHLPKNLTKNVDQRLPTYEVKNTYKFKGSFGKFFKKGNADAGVKLYKTKCLDDFTNYIVPTDMLDFAYTFNKAETQPTTYVVKVSPVTTYRGLLTCYKEAHMNNNIHDIVRDECTGSDLVCKPYMCFPVKTKKSWKFIFVSSLAEGVPVAKLFSSWYRCFHSIQKDEMFNNLTNACDKFWKLGFAHNDLHPHNILFNHKTKQFTFIDLETSVQLTDDIVEEYITYRSLNPTVLYNTVFASIMQYPALHMLRHSETWLNQFTTQKKNHVPILYNNDTEFLSKVSEILW